MKPRRPPGASRWLHRGAVHEIELRNITLRSAGGIFCGAWEHASRCRLFESLPLANPLAAATEAKVLATTASGAPLRTAFVYFPNGAIPKAWWPKGTGADFQLGQTLSPLEPFKHSIQVLGGLNHRTAHGWTGWRRRPRTWQRHFPDRRAPEKECDRHPGRRLHRPGVCTPDRSAHPVPFARAGDRRDPQIGGLRFGLCLCVSVQPLPGARRRHP